MYKPKIFLIYYFHYGVFVSLPLQLCSESGRHPARVSVYLRGDGRLVVLLGSLRSCKTLPLPRDYY